MRTLLIVDDESSVCASLAYLLETNGYCVRTAGSGAEALAVAEREEFDGALVDVHMPVMNGFETCAGLLARARDRGRTLRVWLMTGALTSGLHARATDAGALGVLAKPFDFPGLLAALDAGFSPTIAVPESPAVDAPAQL